MSLAVHNAFGLYQILSPILEQPRDRSHISRYIDGWP